MTKRNKELRNFDLTKNQIDEVFSDILKNLLNDGYTFIYKPVDLWVSCSQKVFLKKGEDYFALLNTSFYKDIRKVVDGQEHVAYYVERKVVLVPLYNRTVIEQETIEEEGTVFYTYYKVSECGRSRKKQNLYSTTETLAKAVVQKKLERSIYKNWLEKGHLMVMKLKATPFVGFRKNVTVIVRNQQQIIENANGKRVYLSKFRSGFFSSNELQKAKV